MYKKTIARVVNDSPYLTNYWNYTQNEENTSQILKRANTHAVIL
jgi:hypothetical protein